MECRICLKTFIVHTLKYDHNFLKIFSTLNGGTTAQQNKLLKKNSVPLPERFLLQFFT